MFLCVSLFSCLCMFVCVSTSASVCFMNAKVCANAGRVRALICVSECLRAGQEKDCVGFLNVIKL